MEKKKMIWGASILFLILVIMNIGIGLIDFGEIPIALNILIPQGLILIPVLIYVLVTKQNLFQLIRFRKINFWSLLLVHLISQPLKTVRLQGSLLHQCSFQSKPILSDLVLSPVSNTHTLMSWAELCPPLKTSCVEVQMPRTSECDLSGR